MQVPGALVRQFRFVQFCCRFQISPLCQAEVRTVKHRQQGVFLHVLADIHVDLHYPAPDERGHLSQFIFVGLNCGGKIPMYTQLATDNRRDLDHRSREFFGCEMEHSWPVRHDGLLGLRCLIGRSLAGNKSSERYGDEENNAPSFVNRERNRRGNLQAED